MRRNFARLSLHDPDLDPTREPSVIAASSSPSSFPHNLHPTLPNDSSSFGSLHMEDSSSTTGLTPHAHSSDRNGGRGQNQIEVEDDGESGEQRLGCLGVYPSWLQAMGKSTWFLAVLCVFCVFQSMTQSGLLPVVISTIERRYGLSSKESGALVSCYDGVVGISVIVFTHFGHRAHRPRWLARCMLVFATGCVLFVMPKIVGSTYRPSGDLTGEEACPLTHSAGDCSTNENYYYALFLLGQFLMAIGASPIYTLGVTFLDDNVPPEKISLYVGWLYTLSCLGPAAGFLLGGAFLTSWVDPGVSTNLTTDSSGWVGAWWAGFAMAGGFIFLAFPLMSMYPKHLPGTAWIRRLRGIHGEGAGRQLEAAEGGGDEAQHGHPHIRGALRATAGEDLNRPNSQASITNRRRVLTLKENGSGGEGTSEVDDVTVGAGGARRMESLSIAGLSSSSSSAPEQHLTSQPPQAGQDFIETLKSLVSNLPFLFLQLGTAGDSLVIVGVGAFLPKVVQTQFLLSASDASFLSGVSVIVGAAGGTLIGGYLAKRWTPVQNARAIAWLALCSLACSVVCLVHCSSINLIGVSSPYPTIPANFSFASSSSSSSVLGSGTVTCNARCNCSRVIFKPVCDPSGPTFQSACHAGCATALSTTKFTNCTCASSLSSVLTDGVCRSDCSLLPVFLLLILLLMLFIFMNQVPVTTVTLRCVNEHERSLALGVGSFLYRVFGAIPGPLIVGAVLDKACLLWETKCDGTQGACWQYHSNDMSVYISVCLILFKLTAAVFYILAYYFVRKTGSLMIATAASGDQRTDPPTWSYVPHDEHVPGSPLLEEEGRGGREGEYGRGNMSSPL